MIWLKFRASEAPKDEYMDNTRGIYYTFPSVLLEFLDFKLDLAFHPCEVDEVSTRNFWDLNDEK